MLNMQKHIFLHFTPIATATHLTETGKRQHKVKQYNNKSKIGINLSMQL